MKISFIIPCYASEGSIELVIREIEEEMGKAPDYQYEIIAVNDSSPDNVLKILQHISKQDPCVRVIDLAKNGGRHKALICGCHYSSGDIVVFVDDDLQCPVDRLWDLLAPVINGSYDVSIAKYPKKQQSVLKNMGSALNDRVSNWLLDKKKDLRFSNFSCMKGFVRDEILRYRNPYPYLSGLMLRATDRVVNVEMEERKRTIGEGHYNLKKSIRLWVNVLTSFSVKPLRVAIACGLLASSSGFIWAIYLVYRKLTMPAIQLGYSSLMVGLLIIGGIIMLLLGMIGEYVGRIYMCLNDSPQFVVRRTWNFPETKDK